MSKLSEYVNNLSFGDEWFTIFGKPISPGKEFCPFHHNVNTPAAKFYHDRNRLVCFGLCNRSFGTYDLLKRFNPDRLLEIKSSIILPEAQSSNVEPPSIKSVHGTLKQVLDSLCIN